MSHSLIKKIVVEMLEAKITNPLNEDTIDANALEIERGLIRKLPDQFSLLKKYEHNEEKNQLIFFLELDRSRPFSATSTYENIEVTLVYAKNKKDVVNVKITRNKKGFITRQPKNLKLNDEKISKVLADLIWGW